MKQVINRLEIGQRAFDAPTRRGFPRKRCAHLKPVHLLSIKRYCVHKLLIHHKRNHRRGRRAVGQKGCRGRCFDDCPRVFFPAYRTGKDLPQVTNPLYFCRGNGKLLPYILPGDRRHRRVTVRAEPLILRHGASHFPDRQVFIKLITRGFRFPLPLIAFNRYLFRTDFFLCLWIFATVPFTGRTKKFPAELFNGFIEAGHGNPQFFNGFIELLDLFVLLFNCFTHEFNQQFHMLIHGITTLLICPNYKGKQCGSQMPPE